MEAYIFRCNKCKHEESYRFGVGLLDPEGLDAELDADKKAAKELKTDVLSGKYGDYEKIQC